LTRLIDHELTQKAYTDIGPFLCRAAHLTYGHS